MAYKDLRSFIQRLEDSGQLRRISVPVSPILEMTEIADRVVKAGGPALLFENPSGYEIPVLMNGFGTAQRVAMALGVDAIEEISSQVEDFLRVDVPQDWTGKLSLLSRYAKLASFTPRLVKTGACQRVVHTEDATLDELPILHCWPGDGGRFITLPMVFSKDPSTGVRNAGMYRMQVYDERTTGMHWHPQKVGARHYAEYERLGRRMEIAVALGGDPALTYAASAPLPDGFDEMIFAGFLRKRAVEMVACKSVSLEVPADCDIVIEGYVEPYERRTEGPFGDHTGYYSLPAEFPVFHVTCITRKEDAIYPATIVGKPPMEDCFIAKAIERIFLPFVRFQIPEIVDLNLPIEGVFHNFAIVAIHKRYPGHARKVMHALWGLGQMATTKILLVVDGDVNVQDVSEVLWRIGNNVDPQRDIEFVTGPVDILDHASRMPGYGSKMGVDATKKLPEEGYYRDWPDEIRMSKEVKERIDSIWAELNL